MKRFLLALTLAFMLGGCAYETVYDEPVLIISKEISDGAYRYKYKIRIKYKTDWNVMKSNYIMRFYSNKHFRVGETIWIGNARGETLRNCNHE